MSVSVTNCHWSRSVEVHSPLNFSNKPMKLGDRNTLAFRFDERGDYTFEVTDPYGLVTQTQNIVLPNVSKEFAQQLMSASPDEKDVLMSNYLLKKLEGYSRHDVVYDVQVTSKDNKLFVVFSPWGLKGGGKNQMTAFSASSGFIVTGVAITILSGGTMLPAMLAGAATSGGVSGLIYTVTTKEEEISLAKFCTEASIGGATGVMTGGFGSVGGSLIKSAGIEGVKKLAAGAASSMASGVAGATTAKVAKNAFDAGAQKGFRAITGADLRKDLGKKDVLVGGLAGGLSFLACEGATKAAENYLKTFFAETADDFLMAASKSAKVFVGAGSGGVGGGAGGALGGAGGVLIDDAYERMMKNEEDRQQYDDSLLYRVLKAASKGALIGVPLGVVIGAGKAARQHDELMELIKGTEEELRQQGAIAQAQLQEVLNEMQNTKTGREFKEYWDRDYRPKGNRNISLKEAYEQLAQGQRFRLENTKGSKSPFFEDPSRKNKYWAAKGSQIKAQEASQKFENLKNVGKDLLPPKELKSLKWKISRNEEKWQKLLKRTDEAFGDKIEKLLKEGFELIDQRYNSRKAAVKQLAQGHELNFHHPKKPSVNLVNNVGGLNWPHFRELYAELERDCQRLERHERAEEACKKPLSSFLNVEGRSGKLDQREQALNEALQKLCERVRGEYGEGVLELQRTGHKLKDRVLNGDIGKIIEQLARGEQLAFEKNGEKTYVQAPYAKAEFERIFQERECLRADRTQFNLDQSKSKTARIRDLEKVKGGIQRAEKRFIEAVASASKKAEKLQREGNHVKDGSLDGNMEAINKRLVDGEEIKFINGVKVSVSDYPLLIKEISDLKREYAHRLEAFELDYGA